VLEKNSVAYLRITARSVHALDWARFHLLERISLDDMEINLAVFGNPLNPWRPLQHQSNNIKKGLHGPSLDS
jgi:hypothetical protein